MAVLYAGRTSGVLVAFFFLPFYSRLLGPAQFGIVAVILSLQALLVMMDLGMSTLVSRDVASGESSPAKLGKLIRTAEVSLSCFYFLLFAVVAVAKAFGGIPGISPLALLAAVILFWLLVLQNLYYSAMLARRLYTAASVIQAVGVIVRAAATAFVLATGFATLAAFISIQLVLAAIHCWVTRWYCTDLLNLRPAFAPQVIRDWLADGVALVKKGRSLILFSAAGAAVMQLDKTLVTLFVSAASVAPYFLATTLCMLPLSILAGPVSQYFQPTLLKQLANQDFKETQATLKKFVLSLLLIISIPCAIFWFQRVPMIDIWMGQRTENITISRYVAILLPGCAVGAFGFIPYTLLLSAKDFRFQAILSACLTFVTLAGVTIAALLQSIEGVCYVYASYHGTSTLSSWMRAIFLPATKVPAKYSFLLTIKGCALFGIAIGVIFLLK
ncbi:MAG: oligosaccharide flippase family protein [Glaciimonas sp.]|nr:oligosaccharide flippase family protein [Glaciimonas sp.]